MMTVARVGREHWHAVNRDLLALGYHESDIGTKLTVWEVISIVIASPNTSSVYQAEHPWSPTDQLLANLGEQQAGLLNLKSRYPRPGVKYFEPPVMASNERPYDGKAFDVMTIDELRQKRAKALAELGVGNAG